jgi:hypothetical protein
MDFIVNYTQLGSGIPMVNDNAQLVNADKF